jgi:hypothetical protein
LANGSLASDAAAFGQIPTLGSAGSSAVADAASAGTAATASHSDHVHGREAFAAPAAATGYGLSAVTGTAATLAHSDHTHGTPALTVTAPAATEAIGTAAALGSATLPALADHVHPMAGAASPTTSAVGDAAATGAATTFAASNHVHGREAFGSAPATTEGIGAAAAAGTASTPSRSDHVHPMAASATAGASAPGDAASAGANATFAASDHRHSREAYAAAATIAAPGTRAAGSSGTVADGGHVHPSVQYSPADYGWISWTGDPEYTVGATVPTQGGTVYHSRVHCPVAFTATNVIILVTSAGGTLTSGQCFAGLYHAGAGGSLIAATADLSSGANSFATSGSFQFPLVGGPYSLAAGDYTVAFFFNGTTGPTLARFSTTYTALGVPNLSLANGTFRHFTDSTNTVRTTSLPGTIGTQSANNNSWFAAIS